MPFGTVQESHVIYYYGIISNLGSMITLFQLLYCNCALSSLLALDAFTHFLPPTGLLPPSATRKFKLTFGQEPAVRWAQRHSAGKFCHGDGRNLTWLPEADGWINGGLRQRLLQGNWLNHVESSFSDQIIAC